MLSSHMSHAKILEDETLKATRQRRKWENADYRGHLRSNEYDPLFDVYQNEHVIVQGVILLCRFHVVNSWYTSIRGFHLPFNTWARLMLSLFSHWHLCLLPFNVSSSSISSMGVLQTCTNSFESSAKVVHLLHKLWNHLFHILFC